VQGENAEHGQSLPISDDHREFPAAERASAPRVTGLYCSIDYSIKIEPDAESGSGVSWFDHDPSAWFFAFGTGLHTINFHQGVMDNLAVC
jgi:hypothetical protein